MAFRLFFSKEQMPVEVQEQFLCRLTLSEFLTLWETSKSARKELNHHPALLARMHTASVEDFLTEINKLPTIERQRVIDEKLTLPTAKMFLLSKVAPNALFTSTQQQLFNEIKISSADLHEIAARASFVSMIIDKRFPLDDFLTQFLQKKKGGRILKLSIVLSNDALYAYRENLITIPRIMEMTADEVRTFLRTIPAIRRNRDYLHTPNAWRRAGAANQAEFEARFAALPDVIQEMLCNGNLTLLKAAERKHEQNQTKEKTTVESLFTPQQLTLIDGFKTDIFSRKTLANLINPDISHFALFYLDGLITFEQMTEIDRLISNRDDFSTDRFREMITTFLSHLAHESFVIREQVISMNDLIDLFQKQPRFFHKSTDEMSGFFKKRHAFLTDRNMWLRAGATNQEDFERKFKALPFAWQESIIAIHTPSTPKATPKPGA